MRDIKLEVITTGAAPVRGKYITGGRRRSRGRGKREELRRGEREKWKDTGQWRKGRDERHGDTLEGMEK